MNMTHQVNATQTVLLPLDGTMQSAAALPIGKTIAGFFGAALHVVHAGAQVATMMEAEQKLSLQPGDLANVVFDTLEEPPDAGILQLVTARHDTLIVMTMRHGDPRSNSGLGSVAEQVLRMAHCPILLVPPGLKARTWQLRNMLLPQDGTPSTAFAIRPAVELARRANAALLILYVAAPKARPREESGTMIAPRYVDQPQHEWPQWAHEFVDRVHCAGGSPESVRLQLVLARGEPGHEILRIAAEREADLIVLPWHGHLEGTHAETLKAVLRATPCPVLVLPMAGEVLRSPASNATDRL